MSSDRSSCCVYLKNKSSFRVRLLFVYCIYYINFTDDGPKALKCRLRQTHNTEMIKSRHDPLEIISQERQYFFPQEKITMSSFSIAY